jgi:antirestriction protein ArdC
MDGKTGGNHGMQKRRRKASEEIMEHTARFEGSDELHHNGVCYKGTDQVGKLCRVLKTGKLSIFRTGKVVMTVDVEKRAEQSLTENDKRLGYTKYTPFDVTRFAA